MKRFFLIAFVVCTYVALADEPMFPSDTEWHYKTSNQSAGTSSVVTLSMKDCEIDGVMYQYISGAYLRAEGAKIWCLVDSNEGEFEKLLYNFDLQVGDSIQKMYMWVYSDNLDYPYAKVTNVETITLADGRKARRLSYDISPDDIEHVGCVNGILAPADSSPIPPSAPKGDGVIYTQYVCCTRGDYVLHETAQGECENLLNGDPHQNIENPIEDTSSTTKTFNSGQIYIIRGDKTYTLTGQQVK